MNRIKRTLFMLLIISGLGAMIFVVAQVIVKVHSNDVKILESLSGAFIGTIFGVGAFIINGWLKSFFDRQHAAQNALVQMEVNFTFLLDEINQNILAFGDSAKHLEKAYLNKPHIMFHEPAFTELRKVSPEYHNLLSSSLKGEIFIFELGRDRAVGDIQNSEKYLRSILKVYNENDKSKLDLKNLFEPLSKRFFEMEAYFKELIKDAESILVMIRIMLVNPPPWIWFSLKLNKAFAHVPTKKEIEKEKAQIQAELIDSKMISEKVIEKIKKS